MSVGKRTNIERYRHFFHISVALFILLSWPPMLQGNVAAIFQGHGLYRILVMVFALPFYFINVYFLVPRYAATRQYKQYGILVICWIVVYICMHQVFLSLSPVDMLASMPEPVPTAIMHIFPLLMLWGMGTGFEMMLRWEKQLRREEAIEKEKINAELTFLKSQINPHFFFNALNTIFSLIAQRSDLAGEAVLLLSNIMRYVLYDVKLEKVTLLQEVKVMEDYIALQRMRIPDSEPVHIEFNYSGNMVKARMEPLLLLVFIENAFKHGISYNELSKIHIDLQLVGRQLTFVVTNTTHKRNVSSSYDLAYSGIGLENVRRRLDLLYGDRYQLETGDRGGYFSAILKIAFSEQEDWVAGSSPKSQVEKNV